MTHPDYDTLGGPPDDNPGWYRGDGGQWRLDPVRKPSLMREGIHALLGAVVAALPFLDALAGVDLAQLLTAQALITILFLAYEITEGWRIRDWCYRDVGGFLMGFVAVTMGGLAMASFC